MNHEGLKDAIYARPFEPVRIKLSNGEAYDIGHPGSIAIGWRVSSIVVEGKLHQIANDHITQVEPLHTTAN